MTIINNLRCNDPRIENICIELFDFLKSSDNNRTIHNKEIVKITRMNNSHCDINIGFLQIRMIFKPYQKEDNIETGSNEGAAVIIQLPFTETGAILEDKMYIRGYFSTRGKEKRLTVQSNDTMKPSTFGQKRISEDRSLSKSNPLNLPNFD